MAQKLNKVDGYKNELNFITAQIKKYIKLYLMWNVVYAPLAIWHYLYTKTNFLRVL